MLVTGDNDVGGAVQVLRRILESADNAVWLDGLFSRKQVAPERGCRYNTCSNTCCRRLQCRRN